MKSLSQLGLLLLPALLLSAAPAHAGVYLEEQSTLGANGQSQSETIKTWIDGDMVRTDDPRSKMTLLINTKKSSISGVNPAEKTWWKLRDSDVSDFGAATLMAYGIKKGPDGRLVVPKDIFQKTGAKKTVKVTSDKKEVTVEVFEVKVNMTGNDQMKGVQSKMWVGTVPGFDPAFQRSRMKMWIGNGPEADEFLKQYDDLGGVPLITEMQIPAPQAGMGTLTMVQELRKVAPQKLNPKDYDVPKAFKQVEDPFSQLKRQMPKQGSVPAGTPTQPSQNAPPPMQ
jgi:hypothetical protein